MFINLLNHGCAVHQNFVMNKITCYAASRVDVHEYYVRNHIDFITKRFENLLLDMLFNPLNWQDNTMDSSIIKAKAITIESRCYHTQNHILENCLSITPDVHTYIASRNVANPLITAKKVE